MPDFTSSKRPVRTRIRNELGQAVTLGSGPEQFETVLHQTAPAAVLFMGFGPEPRQAVATITGKPRIYYIEAPDFQTQMRASWTDQIPEYAQRVELAGLQELLHSNALEIRAYRQNIRLFPTFWAPVFALCRTVLASLPAARSLQSRNVLIAGPKDGLLLKELQTAFTNAGYAVRICEEAPGREVAQLTNELRTAPPSLLFSVNFAGLDPFGEAAALAEATGTHLAVWCVDNPWHLLGKLKSPFWKRIPLFVTDSYFCRGLRKAGAAFAEHLPLAAWPEGMQPQKAVRNVQSHLLFVGRASFPGRSRFFAGLTPPAALFEKALHLLQHGHRPDFSWWVRELNLAPLWPGKEVRLAGFCTEECAWRLRLQFLQQAAACVPLTVCGDPAWQNHFQGTADVLFRGPMDYYGPLMAHYAHARYTLNVTSLLLPHGLTQRHFDVWASGGFLLTDATPGLALFPDELTKPISLSSASGKAAFCAVIERIEKETNLRRDLAAAWRTLITKEHTYDARIAYVLEKLQIK